MGTEHTDPRVRAARRMARALGLAGVLLLVAGGAVPLPVPVDPLDLPAGDAGREALRWGRAAVGAAIVVLLAIGVWERRRAARDAGTAADPAARPSGPDDA